MIALLLAGLAATGTYLLYDALAHPQPRTEMRHFRSATTNAGRFDLDRWLTQAGLEDVERREFLAVIVALGTAGALAGWLLFEIGRAHV